MLANTAPQLNKKADLGKVDLTAGLLWFINSFFLTEITVRRGRLYDSIIVATELFPGHLMLFESSDQCATILPITSNHGIMRSWKDKIS